MPVTSDAAADSAASPGTEAPDGTEPPDGHQTRSLPLQHALPEPPHHAPARRTRSWSRPDPTDDLPRDDDALARAAGLGDPGAFEEIVHRHGPALYRYARRLTRDEGDAQEAVQDALVAAWKGIDRFSGRSSLRTWLFSLTAHKVIDKQRKARAQPIDDELLSRRPAGASADPFEQAAGSELRRALDAALAELPYRQRACWLLVEVEQMSQPEVAEVLSMSPDAVRGQLFRARRNLEERMARWR